MIAKYRLVRRDLEAARRWLAIGDETDQRLDLMIEQVIEAVLEIEHWKHQPQSNVVSFPRRSDRGNGSVRHGRRR